MERIAAATRAGSDHGLDSLSRQILWQEGRLLGYVCVSSWPLHIDIRAQNADVVLSGWAKFMEWKYPVSIEITNPKLFKAAGAIEAAASL